MTYNSQDTQDLEADTATLLQIPSYSSSVFYDKSAQNNYHLTLAEDDYNICHSRHCCSCRERHLATPTPFTVGNCGAEWMQDFEEIARANNWCSKAKRDIIPIYLQDKIWFRETQHEWHDFDSFKLAFVARYKIGSGKIANAEVREEHRRAQLKAMLVRILSPHTITFTFMGLMFLTVFLITHT